MMKFHFRNTIIPIRNNYRHKFEVYEVETMEIV